MPQFTYSATDTTGNVVEGTVAANDMMVAADQVRRMGYTPVRVEVAEGALPGARPLTAVEGRSQGTAAQSAIGNRQSAIANPNTEHQPPTTNHQPPTLQRPAPMDLSQVYATPENTANTLNALNSLVAPTLTSGGELTAPTGRVLEPWERSVTANEVVTGQELAAPQNGTETVQAAGTANALTANGTSAGVTNANGMMATPQLQAGSKVQGRAGIQIPYGAGVVYDKSTWQRFLELIVYPIRSGVVIKELAPYLRQFATLINAGLPLYQSLVALESNTPNAEIEGNHAGSAAAGTGGRQILRCNGSVPLDFSADAGGDGAGGGTRRDAGSSAAADRGLRRT